MADLDTPIAALPALTQESPESPLDEKKFDLNNPDYESSTASEKETDYKVQYVNGEPVIATGEDVSNFAVDIRDDGDPSLTFRSIVLGTVVAGLGAAVSQIYIFKPVDITVSPVFLLLFTYFIGKFWEQLPNGTFLKSHPKWAWLGHTLYFMNPGPFGLKEHAVATLIATTTAAGSSAVNNFAVQKLFYEDPVDATTAVLATFSTACFGYGLVGILRPLTVYPSEMVYWANLPNIIVFQSLHWDSAKQSKRVKLFWSALTGMAIWEVFPQYVFPLLNGFSVFCLGSQKASPATRAVFTNVFGGAEGNEGLGLLEIGLDWQYVTSAYMSFPLIQQANSWIGLAFCYVAVLGIYYSNTWGSLALPMISTDIFGSDGSVYNQTAVFAPPAYSLNQTALEVLGLPRLTGSNVWSLMTGNWAIGGLIAHCLLFWSGYVVDSFKSAVKGTQKDRHWVAMQKYDEVPWWWYGILLVLSFFAGLIVVIKGGTTLPVWGYIIALMLGSFILPFSNLLYARMGNGIATNQLMKMVAGALHPGRPVANLYFSMWSHDCVATAINLAGDLKIGQYLKIPPRVMFLTQVWGTIVGVFVNYAVMASIVKEQREVLLDPVGTNVWSGVSVQSLNSAAITWSLAKEMFSVHSQYFWVPMGLILGAIPTIIQWLISKRWKKIGPVPIDVIILPLIYQYSSWMTGGITSNITATIVVGIVSQVWLRNRHPGWFRKYNYILGGALDGGAQIMVFVLSFAVFGASGTARPFPTWWGNNFVSENNVDYCLSLQS